MIAGTNTNCKILNITVTDATAKIKLLFFANKPTVPAKGFKIFLQDRNLESKSLILESIQDKQNIKQSLVEINNNIYWVDNYDYSHNSLNNININKYKEVELLIDITNNNTSKILENRWVREFYIHIVDIDSPDRKICWSSDLITLISDSLITPRLKSFSHYEEATHQSGTDKLYTLHILFSLYYESELDYNYFNKNFYYTCNIKAADTEALFETIEQQEDYLPTSVEITTTNVYYSKPLLIEILIKNKADEVVLKFSKIYVPTKKLSNTYIKTKQGVKKAIALYIKKDLVEENDLWLDTSVGNSIKTNFNNLTLKKPATSNIPLVSVKLDAIRAVYNVTIDPNLGNMEACILDIKVDDVQYNSIRLTDNYTFALLVTDSTPKVTISGFYVISKYGITIPEIEFYLTFQNNCSETTVCSDETYCNDTLIEGGSN